MTFTLIEADCIEAMASMDEASVDAIVTDPPYLLNFMSKPWDLQLDHHAWAIQALRVLKPGGHLLAFGGTRTFHRLTCGLEDAGFEIRDCLAWLYGSGFPKSLDVSKAIDKAAGAERTTVAVRSDGATNQAGATVFSDDAYSWSRDVNVTAPSTPEAQRWQGWGTALKPAWEPIILARKPLDGTVAGNVTKFGTGALNIDGTRIGTEGRPHREARKAQENAWEGGGQWKSSGFGEGETTLGRWPANVILDEDAAALLDEQSGEHSTPKSYVRGVAVDGGLYGDGLGRKPAGYEQQGYGDFGGASRFFYIAKADREERNRGLEHRAEERVQVRGGDAVSEAGWDIPGSHSMPRANHHPTVKPVELMQWLCRLITPPKGTILDPFTGSGSTGIAALREGFEFIGIEREAEYVAIARDRILGDAPLFNTESLHERNEG